MQITIHQATFGELNGGWDLLSTSMSDSDLVRKLRFKTDLQDRPPSGINWEPAIRGFVEGEFYLLTKTYLDNSPQVRTGRVFSHSLLIKTEDLEFINNLEILLSHFSETINKSIQLKPINYQYNSTNVLTLDRAIIPRFNKVIHCLAESPNHQNIIVWVGQEYFDSVVSVVWNKLSKIERENFSFGLNFNPKEALKSRLNLITIPLSIENKWLNTEYCVVRKNDSFKLTSIFELYLSGDPETFEKINNFLKEIEASASQIEDLAFIAKTIPTYENLNSVNNFNSINTLYQIISEYSPNESKGKFIKQKVLTKFCEIIKTSNEKEILALRNIKTKSYENSETKLSQTFKEWIHTNLFSFHANEKKDYTPVVSQYKSKDKANWWHIVLRKEIKQFLNNVTAEKCNIIWKWILNDVSVLESIGLEINPTKSVEDALLRTFPDKMNSDLLSKVRKFGLSKNWLKLHAISLFREFELEEALSKQLHVDTDKKYLEGINIITDLANPKQVIDFSINNNDLRLIQISGKLCHKNPALLNNLEVSNLNWQLIWIEAIKNGNNIDDGLINPRVQIYKLFDSLIEGYEIQEKLLEEISLSQYANFLEYKNRNKVWQRIPQKIRDNFLSKTATEFLEKLSRNTSLEVPDDRLLQNYITNSRAIADYLYYNRDNFKAVLPLFIKFTDINENILTDYVYNFRGVLDVIDAVQLGQLVAKRKYYRVVEAIYRKANRNSPFLVALNECYFLLGLWDQGFIALNGLLRNIRFTEDMWWEAFQELSYNLYQNGPTDRKIWVEAGGHEYDLLTNRAAKEIWIDALRKLRNGGCEGITIQSLIEKMLRNHKNNERLKALKELRYKL